LPPTTPPHRDLPDVDWLAFKVGLKPANRLTLGPEHEPKIVERARARGYAIARASRTVELPGREPEAVLYVARTAEYARDLAEAEAPILPGGPSRPPDAEVLRAHARLGELLGFPSCCTAAFTKRLARGVTRRASGGFAHEDFVAAEDAAAASRELLGRLNILLPDRTARLIAYYPCRFDCEPAARYAGAVFEQVARVAPGPAEALRTALLRRVALTANGGRQPPGAATADETTEILELEFDKF